MYFLQKFKMCRADHSINFSFTYLKFVKNITQFDLYFLLFVFQDIFLCFHNLITENILLFVFS